MVNEKIYATVTDDAIEFIGFDKINDLMIDAWDDFPDIAERLGLETPENCSAIFMICDNDKNTNNQNIKYIEDRFYSEFYGLRWEFNQNWTVNQKIKYAWFILKILQECCLDDKNDIILTINMESKKKVYYVKTKKNDNKIYSNWELGLKKIKIKKEELKTKRIKKLTVLPHI